MQPTHVHFVFFGTPEFAVDILEEIRSAGFMPACIVAAPDRPSGRGLQLTPPATAMWATEHSISLLQPEKIDDAFIEELSSLAPEGGWNVFIVTAYSKILPKALIELPRRGILNVHPSMLPKLRGPSPIQATILADEQPGVTIMQIDEKMDHGPIVAQREVDIGEWPPRAGDLAKELAHEGGVLLAKTILPFVAGDITPREQDHERATYCRKIRKEDGLIDLSDDPKENFKKIRAYQGWPGTYFMAKRGGASASRRIRVKIADAELESGELVIKTVIPEGKGKMSYDDFLRSTT